MKKMHRIATGLVAGLAAASTVLASTPAQAVASQAPAAKAGNKSLASVLAADGTKFDKNWGDFDITEAAVLAVLQAKPNSPVKLLTQGGKRATALIPTDYAFRLLARDLLGYRPKTEAVTFQKVAGLGIDTVETVLLYHVVAGATLTSEKVVGANGALVKTALGKSFRVRVNHEGVIRIVDKDFNARNATVLPRAIDLNRGNKQVAHGIDRVLRPLDL